MIMSQKSFLICAQSKDDDAEKQLIIRTLESCNGNKTKAARMLNINPTTLYRKMNKYGIK